MSILGSNKNSQKVFSMKIFWEKMSFLGKTNSPKKIRNKILRMDLTRLCFKKNWKHFRANFGDQAKDCIFSKMTYTQEHFKYNRNNIKFFSN